MRNKTLAILAATTVVALGLAVAVNETGRGTGPATTGGPLFPALAAAVNDVARIELTGANGPTTLLRDAGGRWTVVERADHPADRDAVKNLVVGLAAAVLNEPRTAAPDLYPRIGVEEPEAAGAASVRAALRNAAGEDLGTVIVGKTADPNMIGRGPGQVYVRRAGEAQSWLATTPLAPVRADPSRWIDRTLPRPSREQVLSLNVREPTGGDLTLKRGEGADAKIFFATGLPAGALVDEDAANEATGAPAFLSVEDVGPYAPEWFSMSPLYVYKTRDGGTLRLRAAKRDGATWLEVAAEGFAEDYGKTAGRAYRVTEGAGDALLRPVADFVAETAENAERRRSE